MNTFLQVSFSNSRTISNQDDEPKENRTYQNFRFQGSVDWRLNRLSNVGGDITLQVQRSSIDMDRDDLQFESDEAFRPTATASIHYDNQELFRIRRLRFRSRLDLISDAYVPLLTEPEEIDDREDLIWDNRLEYRIGRLELSLRGNHTRRRENNETIVLFEARRFFGGL